MATITGKVERTTKKPKDGYYGLLIDDTWYNTKEDANEYWGKEVKFTSAKKRGDKKLYVKGDIEVTKDRPKRGGRGGGSGGGRGKDPETQAKIVTQHSQEMAIAATRLLLDADAISLGAKNKPDARKTIILEQIEELTAHFFTEVSEREFLKAQKEIDDEFEDDEDADDDFDDEDDDDDGDWED